ncbi:hypothetical protein HC928_24390, partial [bacterium]|nr:hypothetical protein [bacterium]
MLKPLFRFRIPLSLLLALVLLSVLPITAQDMTYNQSPTLDARVESGELPPVADRLPANPYVLNPVDQVGTYGGRLSIPWAEGRVSYEQVRFMDWQAHLVRWLPDFSIEANLLESISSNEDATVWTLRFREGLKWSDGAPFGPDDIMFAWNDVMSIEELYGGTEAWMSPGHEYGPGVLEKVDDLTLTVTFEAPYGMFDESLAYWSATKLLMWPKHYLQDYHINYADPEELQAKIDADSEATDWITLFDARSACCSVSWRFKYEDPNYPTLGPWMVTQGLGTGTQVRMVRNPYFWQVDSAGN